MKKQARSTHDDGHDDPQTDHIHRFLAVKCCTVPGQVEAVQSLKREIDLMRHLDHPNIVQYLGCECRTDQGGLTLHILEAWVAVRAQTDRTPCRKEKSTSNI